MKSPFTAALFAGCLFATSAAWSQALTAQLAGSTTAISASPNSPSIGQPVTLTVKVTGSNATPTGTVRFLYSGQTLATETLSSGAGTFTATTNGLPAGGYSITASYSGDSNYSGSTSPALKIALDSSPTKTTLSALPTSVTPPATVTLTATVNRSALGAIGSPSGTVAFFVAGVPLGTAKMNKSGVATFTSSSQGIISGNYPVTATYSGDASDLASTSSPVTVKVGDTPTVYNFIGPPYTSFTNTACPPTCGITGTLTLSDPLPPNHKADPGGHGSSFPTSFSFTDGTTTVTNSNATEYGFEFDTDSAGNITYFSFYLYNEDCGGGLDAYYGGPSELTQEGSYCTNYQAQITEATDVSGGTWTLPPSGNVESHGVELKDGPWLR
jgi:hypothetical protein